jgi:hypothetical protein
VVEVDRVDGVLAFTPRPDLVDHRLDEALHAVEVHRDVRGVGGVDALALVAKPHKTTFSYSRGASVSSSVIFDPDSSV